MFQASSGLINVCMTFQRCMLFLLIACRNWNAWLKCHCQHGFVFTHEDSCWLQITTKAWEKASACVTDISAAQWKTEIVDTISVCSQPQSDVLCVGVLEQMCWRPNQWHILHYWSSFIDMHASFTMQFVHVLLMTPLVRGNDWSCLHWVHLSDFGQRQSVNLLWLYNYLMLWFWYVLHMKTHG